MYSVGVFEALGFILLIWVIVLSFLIWKEWQFLKQLFPKSETGDFKLKLEEILNLLSEQNRREQILNRNIREVAKEGLRHTQKVGLLRYNPYKDVGGDQSFTLAILNGLGTGFIMTSLHTRVGTRIYTKPVLEGICELQLSVEEKQVLKQAVEENN
ncbi:DUF4446 family protein [Candidatus Daviesbacteria bacterium]|nr:DUF4446 family protein [Candidatus Daviesbacteria bacterium]